MFLKKIQSLAEQNKAEFTQNVSNVSSILYFDNNDYEKADPFVNKEMQQISHHETIKQSRPSRKVNIHVNVEQMEKGDSHSSVLEAIKSVNSMYRNSKRKLPKTLKELAEFFHVTVVLFDNKKIIKCYWERDAPIIFIFKEKDTELYYNMIYQGSAIVYDVEAFQDKIVKLQTIRSIVKK